MARAWCLLKTGNPTRALLDLEAAERLAPELPETQELQTRLKAYREGQGSSTDYYKILGVARLETRPDPEPEPEPEPTLLGSRGTPHWR